MVELPWRRASARGIEVDIPRTLTKRSHVLALPGGEGGVRGKALFDSPSCSPRFFVFRFGGTRQPSSVVLPKKRRMFLPLLGERAGVRGNGTPAVLAASALNSRPESRPKSHMALSHSSFQASGFAGGR